MTVLYDVFKSEISSVVLKEINRICLSSGVDCHLTEKEIYHLLTETPDFSFGQVALACFSFAKLLKQAPPKIACELAEKINSELTQKQLISKVDSVNAYLNFYCDFEKLAQNFSEKISDNSYFTAQLLEKEEIEKIIIEYSQPNTHKTLHVGHLRCLVLGDGVCNLLEYIGHRVVRVTYPGDLGTHVAKVIWYLTHTPNITFPTENKAQWLGVMYAKADEAVKAIKGTNEEVELKKLIPEIFLQVNNQNGRYYELWKETRQWSLDQLKGVYDWLNARFDEWYFESECEEPSKKLVKQKYEEGFFVKDNGAIGIDLSSYKLGFALFLKSDGNGLYLTKDLDLIRRKFSDPAVTKSIVVVDSRQKLHFEQLFKTAELMGYPQAAKSSHLSYETVNTADGKPFSSRELNGLQLQDLKEKMEEKVITDYLERYRGKWDDFEIESTAKNITIGALKYGMLRVDNNTQINFSLEEWLRLDGDTGPYLQYVHARCNSILEKLGASKECHEFFFSDEVEKQLLYLLFRFNYHAVQAAQLNRPSIMASYLYSLAKLFNRFYEACPIRDAQENTKHTRLFLVESTKKMIANGLQLLGIPAPLRM